MQKKLQDEVDEVLGKHNGQVTYGSLQEMPYMDKVFNGKRVFIRVAALLKICFGRITTEAC